MPITPCAPCAKCIGGNISEYTFRQQVILILCNIANSLPSVDNPFVFETFTSIPFGSVNVAYTTTGFFVGATEFNFLRIINNTDSTVDIRIGAAGGSFQILSNGSQVFEGSVFEGGELFMKYDSVAPTLGAVTFEGAAR